MSIDLIIVGSDLSRFFRGSMPGRLAARPLALMCQNGNDASTNDTDEVALVSRIARSSCGT
jgi:hypothetical protein